MAVSKKVQRNIGHSLWAAIALALLGIQGAAAEDKTSSAATAHPSRGDLTPESFRSLWSLVRPQESEWRHLKIQWLTDVVAARKRATAEDKPLVILYTGGAGYNEPLGVC